MKKGSKYITHDQRILLEDCVRDKIPKRKIAEKIGMSLSTVYREIKRGNCKQRRKNTILSAIPFSKSTKRTVSKQQKNALKWK